MSGPRHARPPEPKQSRSARSQGRHRANQPSRSPFGTAAIGVAVVAVATSGGVAVVSFGPSGEADAANTASVQSVAAAEVAAAVEARKAEARAARSQERTRLKALERKREREAKAAEERQARLDRQAHLDRQACRRTAETLDRLDLDREQRRNLRIITNTARRMGLPPRAAVVATATAWQETRLRNLSYGLADSVGMFQQRPSMDWGSVEQLTNPHYATRKFYEGLVEVRGWRRLSIGVAAQAVQRSAYPERYALWAREAWVGVRSLEAAHAAGATC